MSKMKYFLILLLLPTTLLAKVKVVAAISDLAYFAERVGGDYVDVSYIAPPMADVHYIEARPSDMLKVAKADVVLKVGLELDFTWIDGIIDGSRNNHLLVVDCSKHIKPLEVPSFKADARYGDLHRYGNPHYWIGPQNAKPITDAIAEGLSKVDPEHADQFVANQEKLLADIAAIIKKLQPKLDKLKGTEVVYYHDSWPYFNQFTGTQSAMFIEPYPGVAPSPGHVKELIESIRSAHIKVIAMEPYFDKRVPEKIAQETGAKVVKLYPSIYGRNKGETYEQWLEGNVDAILGAIQ
jgi:zinc/manganese transport system substrate-binding protein